MGWSTLVKAAQEGSKAVAQCGAARHSPLTNLVSEGVQPETLAARWMEPDIAAVNFGLLPRAAKTSV